METVEIASVVEAKLHDKLATETSNPFGLPASRLYGVTVTTDEQTETTLLASHPDVYELLGSSDLSFAGMFQFVALVTTGWAAPLDNNGEIEGAPSEHAERRRVRLLVLANRDGMGSVIRFEDNDETVTDAGNATGMLEVAISDFARNFLQ
jgi:hypothetical protein